MMKKLSRIALAALFAGVTASASANPYTSLTFFGDSLADTGNNAVLVDSGNFVPLGFNPGDRTAVPTPSNDFVPTAPYATNRYSNGPVWTDQFAARLGFSATPALLGGNNFAFGGATAAPNPAVAVPDLTTQTLLYAKAFGAADPTGLYVVEGGGNNVRRAFAGGVDPDTAAADYAGGIIDVFKTLLGLGARNLLYFTVPDIGQVPEFKALGDAASKKATEIASKMNAAVLADIAALEAFGIDVAVVDLFTLLDEMVANPAAFGFTDAAHACAANAACVADPSRYFFWDGLHATTAGARIISNEALAALGIPEPESLALVLSALCAMAFARRRAQAGR